MQDLSQNEPAVAEAIDQADPALDPIESAQSTDTASETRSEVSLAEFLEIFGADNSLSTGVDQEAPIAIGPAAASFESESSGGTESSWADTLAGLAEDLSLAPDSSAADPMAAASIAPSADLTPEPFDATLANFSEMFSQSIDPTQAEDLPIDAAGSSALTAESNAGEFSLESIDFLADFSSSDPLDLNAESLDEEIANFEPANFESTNSLEPFFGSENPAVDNTSIAFDTLADAFASFNLEESEGRSSDQLEALDLSSDESTLEFSFDSPEPAGLNPTADLESFDLSALETNYDSTLDLTHLGSEAENVESETDPFALLLNSFDQAFDQETADQSNDQPITSDLIFASDDSGSIDSGSIGDLFNGPIGESIEQPDAEPVSEFVCEPVDGPVSEPVSEPDSEPVSELVDISDWFSSDPAETIEPTADMAEPSVAHSLEPSVESEPSETPLEFTLGAIGDPDTEAAIDLEPANTNGWDLFFEPPSSEKSDFAAAADLHEQPDVDLLNWSNQLSGDLSGDLSDNPSESLSEDLPDSLSESLSDNLSDNLLDDATDNANGQTINDTAANPADNTSILDPSEFNLPDSDTSLDSFATFDLLSTDETPPVSANDALSFERLTSEAGAADQVQQSPPSAASEPTATAAFASPIEWADDLQPIDPNTLLLPDELILETPPLDASELFSSANQLNAIEANAFEANALDANAIEPNLLAFNRPQPDAIEVDAIEVDAIEIKQVEVNLVDVNPEVNSEVNLVDSRTIDFNAYINAEDVNPAELTPTEDLFVAPAPLDERELGGDSEPLDSATELDAAVLAQLDALLAEPPAPEDSLLKSPDRWFLGIDFGTTGISAVLLNLAQCLLYPIYWQTATNATNATPPSFAAPKQFRLATTVTLATTEPAASPLPTIRFESTADTTQVCLNDWKPYLQMSLPHYSPQTSRWEPVLRQGEGPAVPLKTLQEALQQLLATLNPDRISFMPSLSCGALGLESGEFQTALRQLAGVIVGHPSSWSDTYRINLREALLQAELVQQADQVLLVEDAVATLLSALPSEDGRSVQLAQQGQSGHLHNADWQGITLILTAGACLSELVLVNLPAQLDQLTPTDFYVRSVPFAGQGIDQDIICQLLYPVLSHLATELSEDAIDGAATPINATQTSATQTSAEPTAGTPDTEMPLLDLAQLHLETLNLPAASELSPIARYYLQQRLTQSPVGEQLLSLAQSLKITLQHQPHFTFRYGSQTLRIERQDLTGRVLLPYVQRLNRELNTLLAQTNTTAAAVNQVICTGGTAALSAIARWLRQKLPNATIIQDTYPRSAEGQTIPSCSRVAYGLATLPLHPQVIDRSRHQFDDYFLLRSLLRVFPTQPTTLATIMSLLAAQGIDTETCRFRILALLENQLPAGLIPAEADLPLLLPESAANPDYAAIRLTPIFTKTADRTYAANRHALDYLLQYLETLIADLEQQFDRPLQLPELTLESL